MKSVADLRAAFNSPASPKPRFFNVPSNSTRKPLPVAAIGDSGLPIRQADNRAALVADACDADADSDSSASSISRSPTPTFANVDGTAAREPLAVAITEYPGPRVLISSLRGAPVAEVLESHPPALPNLKSINAHGIATPKSLVAAITDHSRPPVRKAGRHAAPIAEERDADSSDSGIWRSPPPRLSKLRGAATRKAAFNVKPAPTVPRPWQRATAVAAVRDSATRRVAAKDKSGLAATAAAASATRESSDDSDSEPSAWTPRAKRARKPARRTAPPKAPVATPTPAVREESSDSDSSASMPLAKRTRMTRPAPPATAARHAVANVKLARTVGKAHRQPAPAAAARGASDASDRTRARKPAARKRPAATPASDAMPLAKRAATKSKKQYKPQRIRCPACAFMCWSTERFRTHMRMHTGEKPFRCTGCNTCFSRRDACVRHIRSSQRAQGHRGAVAKDEQ